VPFRLARRALPLAAAGFAILAACSPRPPAEKPIPLVIAVSSPLHAGLVEVAAAQGLFRREGLDVRVDALGSGPRSLAAMRDGKADLATCAETVVVLAALRGQPVSVLASIATGTRMTALVARHPAIGSPKDLGGKRVGVPRGTTAEFFLDSLLVRHGVERGSVRVVDLKPADAADALERGEVDAVAIWEPYAHQARDRLGNAARVFHAEDIYFETHDLVSRPGFARERPGVAEKVLRALVGAEALLRDRPDVGRSAIREGIARVTPGIEPDAFDQMLGLVDHRVRLDTGLLLLMEEESRWAVRTGIVPPQATPNFLPMLEAGPLRAVKPEAVQLMR
jgi:ABC-type nitrate/sulfonate/bicarbonate transport system substrate-binding protein